MLKSFLLLVLTITVIFFIVITYCAMIVAGQTDRQADTERKRTALEKQICPGCKTGKESYEVDRHSETCPYISSWHDGECSFYVPLENSSEQGGKEK